MSQRGDEQVSSEGNEQELQQRQEENPNHRQSPPGRHGNTEVVADLDEAIRLGDGGVFRGGYTLGDKPISHHVADGALGSPVMRAALTDYIAPIGTFVNSTSEALQKGISTLDSLNQVGTPATISAVAGGITGLGSFFAMWQLYAGSIESAAKGMAHRWESWWHAVVYSFKKGEYSDAAFRFFTFGIGSSLLVRISDFFHFEERAQAQNFHPESTAAYILVEAAKRTATRLLQKGVSSEELDEKINKTLEIETATFNERYVQAIVEFNQKQYELGIIGVRDVATFDQLIRMPHLNFAVAFPALVKAAYRQYTVDANILAPAAAPAAPAFVDQAPGQQQPPGQDRADEEDGDPNPPVPVNNVNRLTEQEANTLYTKAQKEVYERIYVKNTRRLAAGVVQDARDVPKLFDPKSTQNVDLCLQYINRASQKSTALYNAFINSGDNPLQSGRRLLKAANSEALSALEIIRVRLTDNIRQQFFARLLAANFNWSADPLQVFLGHNYQDAQLDQIIDQELAKVTGGDHLLTLAARATLKNHAVRVREGIKDQQVNSFVRLFETLQKYKDEPLPGEWTVLGLRLREASGDPTGIKTHRIDCIKNMLQKVQEEEQRFFDKLLEAKRQRQQLKLLTELEEHYKDSILNVRRASRAYKPNWLRRSFGYFGQFSGTYSAVANAILGAFASYMIMALLQAGGLVIVPELQWTIMVIMGICGFLASITLTRRSVVNVFKNTASVLAEGSDELSPKKHTKRFVWTMILGIIVLIAGIASTLFTLVAAETVGAFFGMSGLGLALFAWPLAITTGIATAWLTAKVAHPEGRYLIRAAKGKEKTPLEHFAELTGGQRVRSVFAGFLTVALSIGTGFTGFYGGLALLAKLGFASELVLPLSIVMAIGFTVATLYLTARALQQKLVYGNKDWDDYTDGQKFAYVLTQITGPIARIGPLLVLLVFPMFDFMPAFNATGMLNPWVIVGVVLGSIALLIITKLIEKFTLQMPKQHDSYVGLITVLNSDDLTLDNSEKFDNTSNSPKLGGEHKSEDDNGQDQGDDGPGDDLEAGNDDGLGDNVRVPILQLPIGQDQGHGDGNANVVPGSFRAPKSTSEDFTEIASLVSSSQQSSPRGTTGGDVGVPPADTTSRQSSPGRTTGGGVGVPPAADASEESTSESSSESSLSGNGGSGKGQGSKVQVQPVSRSESPNSKPGSESSSGSSSGDDQSDDDENNSDSNPAGGPFAGGHRGSLGNNVAARANQAVTNANLGGGSDLSSSDDQPTGQLGNLNPNANNM